jgi:hypothetical protein
MLGSGARAAEIAARKGWEDPVAAQHLAIDALANRRPPPDPSRAASPEAKRLIAFHQCLAAAPARDCAGAMR